MDALIGYTGFVGSVLLVDGGFQFLYNSKNISDIRGRKFRRVVCAGASAVKWWANSNPELDLAGINSLLDSLREIAAEQFVLISTIDVYREPSAVTELDEPSADGLHAYGKNRLLLERWIAERFDRYNIVRLPGLFGPGLKKNAIYDLIHDNNLEAINPASRFQWYPVSRLASDLRRIEEANISLINVATPPIGMGEIAQRFFPGKTIGSAAAPAIYDMRSIHDSAFGGHGGYLMDEATVMDALRRFLLDGGAS